MEVASCSSTGSPLGNKHAGNKRICKSASVRTGRVPASARGSEATHCIPERVSMDAWRNLTKKKKKHSRINLFHISSIGIAPCWGGWELKFGRWNCGVHVWSTDALTEREYLARRYGLPGVNVWIELDRIPDPESCFWTRELKPRWVPADIRCQDHDHLVSMVLKTSPALPLDLVP